ncbi:MAG TPA: cadherin-like domain-containing protein, partial [Alphaproteobacteria bacterium]|nr:cadherin-like domain-containing protein [Alphaproteobacteria bacterium]
DGDTLQTGTGGANNGFGALTTWVNKANGANNAITGGAGTPTILQDGAGYNGLTVLDFDGSDDEFVMQNHINNTDTTIFIVVNKDSVSTGWRTLYTDNDYLLLSRSPTNDQWGAYDGNSQELTSTTLTGGTFLLTYTGTNNGLSGNFRTNGVNDGSYAAGSSNNKPQTVIGDNSGATQNHSGFIGELIVFNRVLNAGEIADVEAYLNTKWFGNTAPTISAISDQTINEDGNTGALAFTVGDAETAAASLSVSATSSDTALIPNGNLVISGAGANRTITVTPTANLSGTATITVSVDDGSGGITTETFDVTVTAVNDAPIIATNTGATMNEGASVVITNAMLNEGDVDDSGAGLTYTASNLSNGHITVNGVTQNTFTQADVDGGLVVFVHDGSETLSAGFDISLADGGENGSTPATGTFSIAVTNVNDAPVIQGWNLVSSEDFQSGATGWAINTTTAGGSFLTTYLGPFSNDGGVQSNSKTYALSGTQDYTVIEFDFYRIDSWDSEAFRIWINDTQVFSQNFTQSVQTVPDGSSGVVSWTVTELITINGHAAGTSNWNDQIFRFTMTIQNSAAASIKLGFGSLTNQGTSDEAWGVDNVKVYEADGGGTPGPFGIAENSANGTVVGNVT